MEETGKAGEEKYEEKDVCGTSWNVIDLKKVGLAKELKCPQCKSPTKCHETKVVVGL